MIIFKRLAISISQSIAQLISCELDQISKYYLTIPESQLRAEPTQAVSSFARSKSDSHLAKGSVAADLQDSVPLAILLRGTFNHSMDVQELLAGIFSQMGRADRVIAIVYNSYYQWLYKLCDIIGIRRSPLPTTFLSEDNILQLAHLAGFEVVRVRPCGFLPFGVCGLGGAINKTLSALPIIRNFAITWIFILRPIKLPKTPPTISIIIPARNERGNIEACFQRIPGLPVVPELIFVEGHSNDGTWEEIQRCVELFKAQYPIKVFRQPGKGKADAVRLGISHANSELIAILDADLTMPPEMLPRFYAAYCSGKADFINGNRLVYPLEDGSMQFLNWLANIFFAKALSFALDMRIGDSLCGTKLFRRADYQRFMEWREQFGDFDPFGDFELLFPAAQLGIGSIDIPVAYRSRTYGQTNISRFRHGWQLLKMLFIGLLRIK